MMRMGRVFKCRDCSVVCGETELKEEGWKETIKEETIVEHLCPKCQGKNG